VEEPGKEVGSVQPEARTCPVCGTKFFASANSGFCPVCILRGATGGESATTGELIGRWRSFLMTEKKTVTMQIAKRVYSLAQEQNDSALMIGAHRSLSATLFWLGDFETARQYAMLGAQDGRSKGVQSPVGEVHAPVVSCLCYRGWSGPFFGTRIVIFPPR